MARAEGRWPLPKLLARSDHGRAAVAHGVACVLGKKHGELELMGRPSGKRISMRTVGCTDFVSKSLMPRTRWSRSTFQVLTRREREHAIRQRDYPAALLLWRYRATAQRD